MSVPSPASLSIIPSLSVHRIDHRKIIATFPESNHKEFSDKLTYEKIERLLTRIIELYNEANTKEGKDIQYNFREVKKNGNKWNPAQNCEFRIKVVVREILLKSTSLSPFLKECYGSTEDTESRRIEHISFFYRKSSSPHLLGADVFAISDGANTYKAFARFRDEEFSRFVAIRLLGSKISTLGVRPIFGEITQTSSKHEKSHKADDVKEGRSWAEKLTAVVANPSVFPGELKTLKDKPPKVEYREKALTLHCQKLSQNEFISLLHFYSEVYEKARETSNQDQLFPLSFLDNIVPVFDALLLPALETALSQVVWSIFKETRAQESSMRFTCPDLDEFYRSHEFSFNKNFNPSWAEKLSTNGLINKLTNLKNFSSFVASKLNPSDKVPEEFIRKLKNITLYFKSGSTEYRIKLIKGFEGEFISETGEHFFRIKGKWLKPRGDYFAQLNRRFKKLLSESLISTDSHASKGALPEKWVGHTDGTDKEDVEGKYNLLYAPKYADNYICGDKACPRSRELFDILFYDEATGKVFLYQVKADFSNSVRNAASQIKQSAQAIREMLNNEGNTLLEEFGKELEVKNKAAHDEFEKWGGVKKLKQTLKGAVPTNIVFVYALANKNGTDRWLEDELKLLDNIDQGSISFLAPLFTAPYSIQNFLDELKANKIIDDLGQLTFYGMECFAKEQLFLYRFQTSLSNEIKAKLFRMLSPRINSPFKSTIPRDCLLEASEAVKAQGFSFAIYQIPHSKATDRSLPLSSLTPHFISISNISKLNRSDLWSAGSKFEVTSEDLITSYILEPTLDYHLSVLHSLKGEPDALYQSFCFKVNGAWDSHTLRKSFTKSLKEFLEKYPNQKEEIEKSIRNILAHLFSTNNQESNIPANSESLGKWLGSKDKKEFFYEFRKLNQEFYTHFHDIDLEGPSSEMKILMSVIKKSKDTTGKGTSQHPNSFIKVLYNADLMDQKERIRIAEMLLSDENLTKNSYESNKLKIRELVLGKPSDIWDDLGKFYSAQDKKRQIDEEFQKINVLESYFECLQEEDYPYGLEEVELAAKVFDVPLIVYAEDCEKQIFPLLDTTQGKNPTRIIFMKQEMDGYQSFFACSKSSTLIPLPTEDETLLPVPLRDMDKDEPKKSEDTEPPAKVMKSAAPSPFKGIKNVGNTCFISSVLQVILNDETLCDAVFKSLSDKGGSFLVEEEENWRKSEADTQKELHQIITEKLRINEELSNASKTSASSKSKLKRKATVIDDSINPKEEENSTTDHKKIRQEKNDDEISPHMEEDIPEGEKKEEVEITKDGMEEEKINSPLSMKYEAIEKKENDIRQRITSIHKALSKIPARRQAIAALFRSLTSWKAGGTIDDNDLKILRGFLEAETVVHEDAQEFLISIMNLVDPQGFSELFFESYLTKNWEKYIAANEEEQKKLEAHQILIRDISSLQDGNTTVTSQGLDWHLLLDPFSENTADDPEWFSKIFDSHPSVENEPCYFQEGWHVVKEEKKSILTPPKQFFLMLKRFCQDPQGNRYKEQRACQIQQRVKIGAQAYQLQSIIVHTGKLTKGHYFSLIHRNKQWWIANDEYVTPANDMQLDEALKNGYLYLYKEE